MSELGDGHGPAHIGQESGNDAIPECRMRKRILVDSVTVHQATSRLMKKERIHCKTRDIQPKSSKPDATGHSPWWKELGTRSSGQRRSIPHALQSNVPDRHGPNLSTRRTTRPGNATVEPIPDGMQPCEHPRPNPASHHRRHKSPGHDGETSGTRRLNVLKTAFSQLRRKAVTSAGEI